VCICIATRALCCYSVFDVFSILIYTLYQKMWVNLDKTKVVLNIKAPPCMEKVHKFSELMEWPITMVSRRCRHLDQ
jgi:hypothetical protein